MSSKELIPIKKRRFSCQECDQSSSLKPQSQKKANESPESTEVKNAGLGAGRSGSERLPLPLRAAQREAPGAAARGLSSAANQGAGSRFTQSLRSGVRHAVCAVRGDREAMS